MIIPRRLLCVITDERSCPVDITAQVLRGGARMVQLRRKNATGRELYAWSVRMQELCRQHNALFIVNDRVDIALAMGADGVHLGQQDMPVSVARRLLGAETIIGVSVSSETEAVLAAEAGASYLGVGHIFRTVSKQKTTPPIGLESVRPVCLASALPVIAIGGIDLTNAAGVIDAGATGIAVISAVSGSSDPETATRKFMNIIRQR